MTDYLRLDDVLAAAEAHLGRPAEVGDYGLLESAVARPQSTVFGEEAYHLPGTAEDRLFDLVIAVATSALATVAQIADALPRVAE